MHDWTRAEVPGPSTRAQARLPVSMAQAERRVLTLKRREERLRAYRHVRDDIQSKLENYLNKPVTVKT